VPPRDEIGRILILIPRELRNKKAAEGSRTPRRFARNWNARKSARSWSAAALCRFHWPSAPWWWYRDARGEISNAEFPLRPCRPML